MGALEFDWAAELAARGKSEDIPASKLGSATDNAVMDQDFTKLRLKKFKLSAEVQFIECGPEKTVASNQFGMAMEVATRYHVNAYSIRPSGLSPSLHGWNPSSRVRKTHVWWVSPRSNVAKSMGPTAESQAP